MLSSSAIGDHNQYATRLSLFNIEEINVPTRGLVHSGTVDNNATKSPHPSVANCCMFNYSVDRPATTMANLWQAPCSPARCCPFGGATVSVVASPLPRPTPGLFSGATCSCSHFTHRQLDLRARRCLLKPRSLAIAMRKAQASRLPGATNKPQLGSMDAKSVSTWPRRTVRRCLPHLSVCDQQQFSERQGVVRQHRCIR